MFSSFHFQTLHDEASIFSILEDPAAAPWDISHLCDFAECDIEPDSFADPIYLKHSNQVENLKSIKIFQNCYRRLGAH